MVTDPSSKKVTEKSTKQDLWTAYNELLSQTAQEPLEINLDEKEASPPDEAFKHLSELKLKISQQLDSSGEELLKDLNALYDTKNTILKEKKRLVEHFAEQKDILNEEIAKIKKQWEQDQKIRRSEIDEENRQDALAKKRQKDEYDYVLELQRRKGQDEFTKAQEQKEQAIKEKSATLQKRENEITKKEIQLEKEINEIKNILTKEISIKFDTNLHEAKFQFEHEKQILELKIANQNTLINSQNKEIETLKKQLAESSQQLKEIAISVIGGQKNLVEPPIEK